MTVLEALTQAAKMHAQPLFLTAQDDTSGTQVLQRSESLAKDLSALGARRIATVIDNGPSWLIADMAIQHQGLVHIPLPAFFHPSQIIHALKSAAVDVLISDQPLSQFGSATDLTESSLRAWAIPVSRPVSLPDRTALITFTSGTTGEPKGVCLSTQHLERVAMSLTEISRQTGATRHLSLLPLGVLLEQVAGAHATLLVGGQLCLPSLAETGLSGASRVDGEVLARCLRQYRAHSAILLPQMLDALCAALEQGAPPPTQLRFLAVGGGRVSPSAIERALALGLPVYQGYGLSETGSVLCLEMPNQRRAGSVGKPLPGRQVRVDQGHQVWVDDPGFLGYLGERAFSGHAYPTGDLGHFDDDGFLHLHGRQSNVLITAFGRNVSPEWLESELVAHPLIAQAFVCGDAEAWLQAVLVPTPADATEADIERAVVEVNAGLPDYARIGGYVRAPPFAQTDGLITSNGRLRRMALQAHYSKQLDALWDRKQASLQVAATAGN